MLSTTTDIKQLDKREGVKLQAGSLANTALCQTRSNALEISRMTTNNSLKSLREDNQVQGLYKNSTFLFVYKQIYYLFSLQSTINNLQADIIFVNFLLANKDLSWPVNFFKFSPVVAKINVAFQA